MTIARIEDVAALAQAFGADMAEVKPNVRKISTDAGRAPLVSDDASQGFATGSRWVFGGREWVATDTTPGAAKWRPVSTPLLTDFASAQAAVDWLAGSGGEMVIPAGVHALTAPINLSKLGPTGRRAVLRGEGQSSVLEFSGFSGESIYAGDPVTQGSSLGWDLRDFRIRGQANTAGTGIFLERANSARIKRVWFERMQDAILISETYGARITECHATSLGRDFLRAAGRTFHLVMRENGAFGIGGYFLNLMNTDASLNIRLLDNDIEVCGGVVKSAGRIHGLSYQGNYMEQSSGPMFDFSQAVRGEISAGNTFQMSGAQTIANLLGAFHGNHVIDIQVAWGANSFPSVGNNAAGPNGTVAPSPKRVPVIGNAYMAHRSHDQIGYYKDPTGRVYLQGNATRDTAQPAPTLPYVLFNLPVGFRPASPMTFGTQGTTNGITKFRITGTGDVVIEHTGTGDIGLGGINFMAA